MKFNIDKYKDYYAMHCKTEKEAKIFCKFLHDNGRKWKSGGSYLKDTYWYSHGGKTVYAFNDGTMDDIAALKTVTSYIILEFSDFDWDREKAEYCIGEEYITADSKKDLKHSKCFNILAAYIPNAIKPFVCVAAGWEQEYNHGHKFDTIHVKYICKPKFKEYTEFKPDMIGLKIKDFKGNLLEIVGDVSYNKSEVCLREVATNHCTIESLSDLYGYDREDGTPFGEEIK